MVTSFGSEGIGTIGLGILGYPPHDGPGCDWQSGLVPQLSICQRIDLQKGTNTTHFLGKIGDGLLLLYTH
jgi:hypothetical protein